MVFSGNFWWEIYGRMGGEQLTVGTTWMLGTSWLMGTSWLGGDQTFNMVDIRLYIWKKINGDTNRRTDRPNIEYSAIGLWKIFVVMLPSGTNKQTKNNFWILKAEFCNIKIIKSEPSQCIWLIYCNRFGPAEWSVERIRYMTCRLTSDISTNISSLAPSNVKRFFQSQQKNRHLPLYNLISACILCSWLSWILGYYQKATASFVNFVYVTCVFNVAWVLFCPFLFQPFSILNYSEASAVSLEAAEWRLMCSSGKSGVLRGAVYNTRHWANSRWTKNPSNCPTFPVVYWLASKNQKILLGEMVLIAQVSLLVG